MMCTWVCVWTLHTKRIQRRPAGHISRNCKIQIILYKDKPSKGGWGESTKKKNRIYACTIEYKYIYVSVCTVHMRCVCMWWCVSIFEISSTFCSILSYRNVKPLKIGGQLMAFKASTRRAVHATRGNKIKIDQALTFHHDCRFAFLYLQGAWNGRRGEEKPLVTRWRDVKKQSTLPASDLKSPCPWYDGPVDVLGLCV